MIRDTIAVTHGPTIALLAFAAAACTPTTQQAGEGPQPTAIDKAKLHGVWQIMTIENLETGEVDSVANYRTIWTHYTDSHWTYVWMDAGREGSTPEEFAGLAPEAQHAENRAKMLDDEGEWRFWGSGGEWWLDGDIMGTRTSCPSSRIRSRWAAWRRSST